MEDVKNGKIAPYALAKISLLTFSNNPDPSKCSREIDARLRKASFIRADLSFW